MKQFVLLFLAVVFAPPIALSETSNDSSHAHEAKHGGYFGDAANIYHYELLTDFTDEIKLYLYDEEARPLLVHGLPARYTIYDPEQKPLFIGPFKESERGDFYMTPFPSVPLELLHILIEVKKNDEWVPYEFLIPKNEGVESA